MIVFILSNIIVLSVYPEKKLGKVPISNKATPATTANSGLVSILIATKIQLAVPEKFPEEAPISPRKAILRKSPLIYLWIASTKKLAIIASAPYKIKKLNSFIFLDNNN